MKHRLFITAILLMSFVALYATDYYTVFKVGTNVCTPITLKTPYGTYTLTSEVRIPNSLSWFEAFDCNGKKIINYASSVSYGTGQTTIRTYVFNSLISPNGQQETNEDSSYSESNVKWVDDDIMYNDIAIDMERPFCLLFVRENNSACNNMISLLNEVASEYPSVDFYIADVDANPLMKERCQVYSVPFIAMTCTLDAKFYKGYGVMTKSSLEALIEKGIRKWANENR